MKAGNTVTTCGKLLLASAVALMSLVASARTDENLQAILDERDPKGSPVRLGYWSADLAACRAKAEKEKIPLLAVWSQDGCYHCQLFEKAIASEKFRNWRKESGIIFCFLCSNDPDAKQPSSANYVWCKGPKKEISVWPLVRFYWPSGGVDFAVRGDVLDKQENSREKAGGYVIDYIMDRYIKNGGTKADKAPMAFGSYVPKPSYLGGYFDCTNAPTLRLEAEPTTKTLYIPLKRETTDATTQQIKITRSAPNTLSLSGANLSAAPTSLNVTWAADQTNQLYKIDNFDTTLYVTNGTVTLSSSTEDGEVITSADIYCLPAQDVTVANPLWIGERTAETLEFGEWTMDIDVAKAKASAADGDAFTLVAIEGSLWCGDCKNTGDNFLDVMDGATNRFAAWAAANNVALAMIDVPRFTNETVDICNGYPTLLSRKAYKQWLGEKSGLSYLSRKGVSDEDAAACLTRNRQLVQTDVTAGGLHTYDDPGYRTWVPDFLMLRKDGTVAARLGYFGKTESPAAGASWDNIIKRFDEMLVIAKAAPADTHYDDIANNDASTTTLSFKANGGSATGELSHTDPADVFKLDGIGGNALQKVTVTGESEATVTVEFVKLNGAGKSETVGTAESGKLSNGVSVEQTFTAAGEFFVKVSCDVGSADFGPENAKASNFAPFTISGAVVLVPQEERTTGYAAEGTSKVTMRLRKDQMYRINGLKISAVTEYLEPKLEPEDENYQYCEFFTGLVDDDVELEVPNKAGPVTYQTWVPCTVGFSSETMVVKESDGEVLVPVARKDGKSGAVKVKVSLDLGSEDDPKTTFYDVEGRPRFEFAETELEWGEGENHETNVVVKVLDDRQYDGDGNIALKLELVSDENNDTKLTTTNFLVKVTEDDKSAPGLAAFTRAEPFLSASQTVYARASEGATIYVSRLEASDGFVSVQVKPGLAGMKVEIDGVETNLMEWANHRYQDHTLVVKDVPEGKKATLVLEKPEGGLGIVKASSKVTIVSVSDNAIGFKNPDAEETLARYVSFSNAYELASMPAGKVTLSKVSGALPAGLKAAYSATLNAMVVQGVPSKAGVFEAVFQVKDGNTAGLAQRIVFNVVDPSVGAEGVVANPSIAKSRTLKDLMVIDGEHKRLRGIVQLTIPTKGNLSAKYQCSDGTVSFSTKGWSAFDMESGELKAVLAAKNGYAMDVEINVKGAVFAVLTKNGETEGTVLSDGTTWSKDNTAAAWQGYYTALMPAPVVLEEGTEGIAPRGIPYLTLKMDTATATKSGTMTWAGVLPNGTAVSGKSVLAVDGEIDIDGDGVGDFAYMPFFKKSSSDLISGAAKILKDSFGKTRACVFAHDLVKPVWEHTEKNAAAGYVVEYGFAGSYYDKKNDNLLACCLETYQGINTHQGESVDLDFGIDGTSVKKVVVQSAKMALQAGDNPRSLTLKFDDKTGLISGTFKDGSATRTYKGVVVLGLGGIDCGCGELPPEGLLPFAAGSYYYSGKVEIDGKNVTVKLGGKIDIDKKEP